jgi:hypothetical protein
MTLTIKDLSTSIELDRAALTGVHGGANANSAVQSIAQAQQVEVPVGNNSMFGAGSTNIDVDVDADQHARNRSYQYNGDSLGISLVPFMRKAA